MSVAPVREDYINVGGISTHVRSGGSGPPLLYLHGVAPAGEWLPLHERLAERFHVYLPDHPGFGLTDRPDWFESMDDMVLHYDELMRALGVDRPCVAGFSLGGWIASEFTVTYPDRVRSLVLLNAAGLHLDSALIPDLAALGGDELAWTVFFDQAAAKAYFGRPDNTESRLQRYRGMTTLALLAWNPWFNPRLQRRLGRVQCPTLALWGREDRLIAPAYGEAFRDAIPGARLELIEDCGHMAPLERPDAVADAIFRFTES